MIRIRIGVETKNDLGPGPLPASDWMFGPIEKFWRKAIVYSPYWTGALRSSVAMEETADGSGYDVTAGDPYIHNPVTGTPTSEYAPIQEEEKHFMADAYLISGVKQKLEDAAAKVFE